MKPIHKRIRLINARFVKKLATQVRPWNKKPDYPGEQSDQKQFAPWYTENLITPMQMAEHVKHLRISRCQPLARFIRNEERGRWYIRPWGNVFTIKFPMCIHVHLKPWNVKTLDLEYRRMVSFYNEHFNPQGWIEEVGLSPLKESHD